MPGELLPLSLSLTVPLSVVLKERWEKILALEFQESNNSNLLIYLIDGVSAFLSVSCDNESLSVSPKSSSKLLIICCCCCDSLCLSFCVLFLLPFVLSPFSLSCFLLDSFRMFSLLLLLPSKNKTKQ